MTGENKFVLTGDLPHTKELSPFLTHLTLFILSKRSCSGLVTIGYLDLSVWTTPEIFDAYIKIN